MSAHDAAYPRLHGLIATLHDLLTAYESDGTVGERFMAIDVVLGERSDELRNDCEQHLAYAGRNYYSFLWRYYKSHGATSFLLPQVRDVPKMLMYPSRSVDRVQIAFAPITQDHNAGCPLLQIAQHGADRHDHCTR